MRVVRVVPGRGAVARAVCIALIGALTALGLSIGCVPSIAFGIPYQ